MPSAGPYSKPRIVALVDQHINRIAEDGGPVA